MPVTSSSPERDFFRAELARFGPEAPVSTNLQQSECDQYCRMWASRQYENFTVVSWLLPRPLRQHFYNVYSYCRWSDNLADEIESDIESLRLLDWWEGELVAAETGQSQHPVMLALGETISQFDLSLVPFRDLLSAFRQDRRVQRYDSNAELIDYCKRSADPVGRILLSLARADSTENIELSDQVCTGLQLANFCQDMARDAAIGRIYAPRELYENFGVSESMLLEAKCTSEMQEMLAAWVAATRQRFDAGWELVHRVPKWLATDIELFIRGGTKILDQIAASGYDVWTQRPVVSKSQKLLLVAQAFKGRALGRPRTMTPNWGSGQSGVTA